MEIGGHVQGAGHASSSRARRSASPIRSDSRGFRAGFNDVQHKLREYYTIDRPSSLCFGSGCKESNWVQILRLMVCSFKSVTPTIVTPSLLANLSLRTVVAK